MSVKLYNPVRDGLELQLEILRGMESSCEDDILICVMCYQEEDECQCREDEKLLWPITHAVRLLESVVGDMA